MYWFNSGAADVIFMLDCSDEFSLQEYIFHLDGIEQHGWFVTLVQFFYYSFFALIQLAVSKEGVSTK